jgi:hypothetical protein
MISCSGSAVQNTTAAETHKTNTALKFKLGPAVVVEGVAARGPRVETGDSEKKTIQLHNSGKCEIRTRVFTLGLMIMLETMKRRDDDSL